MEHLGPPMADWWQTMETPTWGDELVERVVTGVDDELAAHDDDAVRATRDRLLEGLLRAKAAVRDELPAVGAATTEPQEFA